MTNSITSILAKLSLGQTITVETFTATPKTGKFQGVENGNLVLTVGSDTNYIPVRAISNLIV